MDLKNYQTLHQHYEQETQLLDIESCIINHTMHPDVLRSYIQMKIPLKEMLFALENENEVEIHGIYPIYAEEIFLSLGYQNIEIIKFQSNPKKKEYNYIRPYFFSATRKNKPLILVAVSPGKDYVRQYGEMMRFFFYFNEKEPDSFVKIIHYPKIYDSLPQWTNFNSEFVQKDDLIIIGYVAEIENYIKTQLGVEPIYEKQNDFFGSRKYKIGNKSINFLGVKFSFWGNISAKIASEMCELGATEIIYSAKTASLTSTQDLYSRLFCAEDYLIMNCEKIIERIQNIPNHLLVDPSNKLNNSHVSIPTVIEEDFKQREVAIKKGAKSLDNETSQIASVIKSFNTSSIEKTVKFSFLHYATDYLYGPQEAMDPNTPNLIKGRQKVYEIKKTEVLNKMSKCIHDYLIVTSL